MSLYELVFIARQEVSPVRAKELAKKVNDFIKTKGGKIKKEEYWGFKNLAYQIKNIVQIFQFLCPEEDFPEDSRELGQ